MYAIFLFVLNVIASPDYTFWLSGRQTLRYKSISKMIGCKIFDRFKFLGLEILS